MFIRSLVFVGAVGAALVFSDRAERATWRTDAGILLCLAFSVGLFGLIS